MERGEERGTAEERMVGWGGREGGGRSREEEEKGEEGEGR